jgi:predicted alpha/beta hydrolase
VRTLNFGPPAAMSPARAPETAVRDGDHVALTAADGYPIAASHYAASGWTRAHIVVAGTIGVPQRFYRHFAKFAAAAGFSALTFDYRGVARSAPASLDGFRMDYFDWGRLDLAAAVCAMSRPDVPLYIVGHSFGGHGLGLLPEQERVAAMATFGTGAGWHGWMKVGERIKALAMWHLLAPLITRWKGHLAWSSLGMGEDVPLDVYRRWKRWCQLPRYFFDDPSVRYVARRFARVHVPLLALNATDDRWSPPASRDAFIAGYRNAACETVDVEPAAFGLESIGSMGYFRADAVRLWEYALAWLDGCTARARAERQSVTTHAPWRARPSNRRQGETAHGIEPFPS